MNKPTWLKPFAVGTVVGAVAISAYGFTFGGWVTEQKASIEAGNQARAAIAKALVPICVEKAMNDENRASIFAALREAKDYEQKQIIMEAGWATVPGPDGPENAVAGACLEVLRTKM